MLSNPFEFITLRVFERRGFVLAWRKSRSEGAKAFETYFEIQWKLTNSSLEQILDRDFAMFGVLVDIVIII
ncbi:hypothetical protein KR51_00001210 [Rubidibacter lacunae KORDI 51-2]|uniref:Uncharacterized protein n=1 Tax=Rubidibacter lacunae KORDI 51-2 TaxID=582515 RepID=U5DQL9_9CHRO|nr:hypothetical protein KR51_00001210 [Rubidibacter lacunae KORDI 51-2]